MGYNVLIVDDAEFMREMLKDIIEGMGWTVTGVATDGEEAVAQYRMARPDLVLMDITMPTLDGIVALKRIMVDDPEAQVVMISALGQKDLVLEAVQAGARDFIIKPLDHDRVVQTLTRLQGKAALPV